MVRTVAFGKMSFGKAAGGEYVATFKVYLVDLPRSFDLTNFKLFLNRKLLQIL